MGLEKYSPNLDLRKLKAAINLNYDQYNNRREFICWSHENIVVRPFPEVKTPHYEARYGGEKAKYQIYIGDIVLTEMIELDGAIKYAKEYIKTRLEEEVEELQESNRSDCLYCYVSSNNRNIKVKIKEI